jgi:spermidine synthase
VVGLGTGTTACYSRSGENWDYYEIDPAVAIMAASGRLFSFIKECAPDAHIVLGDARISLRSAPDSSYDLIVLDAFSSDAIPVHLMTREVLQLYLSKLKAGGAVVFHISNRYLALEPVLVELARDARLAGASRLIEATIEERRQMQYSSRWVAMARNASTLGPLTKGRGWDVLAPSSSARVWTDDYADVIGALTVFK